MRRIDVLLCALLSGTPALAQAPLSAIDWLNQAPVPVARPLVPPAAEPPVSDGVSVPEVTVMPLDETVRDAVGLLPGSVTGLPASLWSASREADLMALWIDVAEDPLPAIQALYYTLLLAEAEAPTAANGAFLASRVDNLLRLGAVEPAQALVERAGPETPGLFARWFDLTLLSGDEDKACAALTRTPDLHPDYAARIYCTALAGDWATAALLFDSADALGALQATERRLLAHFLDPEAAEDALELAPARTPTPLIFRLYEAVGTPLPTRNLPLAFAVADLRNSSGWKAELEAAERLVRTGALSENRLLALYTDRSPAASGGVWDRVEAIQALDNALSANDGAAASRALTPAWRHMRGQGLEAAFARLFAERLGAADLTPEARHLAYRLALLTPEYETAPVPADADPETRFLASIARGAPEAELATTPAEQAILRAFAPPVAAAHEDALLLREGKLGEAILQAAARFDRAAGNLADLTAGLRTLRAVGLEDTARRAALQLLILDGAA